MGGGNWTNWTQTSLATLCEHKDREAYIEKVCHECWNHYNHYTYKGDGIDPIYREEDSEWDSLSYGDEEEEKWPVE